MIKLTSLIRNAFLLIATTVVLSSPSASARTFVTQACTDGEKWVVDERLPRPWMDRFQKSVQVAQRNSRVDRTLSDVYIAQRLKSSAQGPELKALSEYWAARLFYRAGLVHLASEDFNQMLETVDPRFVGIQIGVIECLTRIHQKYPSFQYRESASRKISELLAKKMSARQRTILWEAALEVFLSQIANGSPRNVAVSLKILQGSGAFESLARAWLSVRAGNNADSIRYFEAFLQEKDLPTPVKRFQDLAHLNLAHIYSEERQFSKAVRHYQSVSKSSNYLAQTLADLSWTHLIARKFGASIGASNDIRRSGLNRSFAPHSDMAIAVSLFELCRYPESFRALREYKQRYAKSFQWLNRWHQDNSSSSDPMNEYKTAIGFVKGDKEIPLPIGTEWMRSPVFQSLQEEMNLLVDGKVLAQRFIEKSEKMRVPASAIELSSIVAARHQQLRSFIEQSPKIELVLMKKIGEDLAETNRSLLSRLQAVDDEMEFLKTEIYDAAGEDIVWQNVNQEFDRFAKNEGITSAPKGGIGADQLRWELKRSPSGEMTEEIWEDELGALETEQLDYCRTKKKFLKKKRTQEKLSDHTVGD